MTAPGWEGLLDPGETILWQGCAVLALTRAIQTRLAKERA